jgi:hypothetical protein
MRSINNTEQFIKAKQVIAAQEKKAGISNGRNRKNLNLTDIAAIANSTNSSLMQSKSPFDGQVTRKAKASPDDPIRYKQAPKYPKGVAVSQDMRETLQKFNNAARADQPLVIQFQGPPELGYPKI